MRYCLPVLPSIFHGYRRVFIYYCLQSLIHILTSGAHIVQLSENMWRIYKVRRILGLCSCAVPSYNTYRIWYYKHLLFIWRHVIWQLHHPRQRVVGSPLPPNKEECSLRRAQDLWTDKHNSESWGFCHTAMCILGDGTILHLSSCFFSQRRQQSIILFIS